MGAPCPAVQTGEQTGEHDCEPPGDDLHYAVSADQPRQRQPEGGETSGEGLSAFSP